MKSSFSVTTIEHASHSSFDDAQDDPIINVTDDLSWDCECLPSALLSLSV